MIALDVLLVANLVLFAVYALRPRRPARARLDDLLATVQRPADAAGADSADAQGRQGQPGDVEPDSGSAVIIAFPSAEELDRRRARALHPSGGALGAGYGCGRHPSLGSASVPHPSVGHS